MNSRRSNFRVQSFGFARFGKLALAPCVALLVVATSASVALGHDLPNHAPHVHDSWFSSIPALAPIAQPAPLLCLAACTLTAVALLVRLRRVQSQRA